MAEHRKQLSIMNSLLGIYYIMVDGVRTALLWIAIIFAVLALADWLVRTRRISPFSGFARFIRKTVDPLIAPMERRIVRAGGTPAAAPWWTLAVIVVGGLLLVAALQFIGGILQQIMFGLTYPGLLPRLLINWAFDILQLALLVRVITSWIRVSPYSPWVRWSFALTEWIIRPLRQVIPPLGMVDITPIAAYFLLWLLQMAVMSII